ncbi:hypothetical protein TrLO_g5924 [Triparma laevis f. longispina]|uniref:Uncharacterized protein n=2 Tax=Triparma laevis f. longispina TaxID=1714387 RepID=A0A9W7BZ91_9STRA|nr:hypothetical protein TrLO_g5924 [Triparma laevis f. longispina]
MDLFSKKAPCKIHPFFVILCMIMLILAVIINAMGLHEQIHGYEHNHDHFRIFPKNHILLLDKLVIPFALLSWSFIVVSDVRGSTDSIYFATLLLVSCSVLKIVGQLKGAQQIDDVEEKYFKLCINETLLLDDGYDKCFDVVSNKTLIDLTRNFKDVKAMNVLMTVNQTKMQATYEKYSTAFLTSTSRGMGSNIIGVVGGLYILWRAVFPGRKELSEFEQKSLEQIILKDNIVFFCSVFSAMMFVFSQATACLGDHRDSPESCLPVVQSCSVAMYFGCAAFAAKILIFPFKTTLYDIKDLMSFDIRFHEQCQALIGIWSVVIIIFVFASGTPLKGFSFYTFVHTNFLWGYRVRDNLFSFSILFMLSGLSITSPKAVHIRKYSERQQRRERRLARLADYLRIKQKSTRPSEWAPALRYSALGLSIFLNASSLFYFIYAINDYTEWFVWHDIAIFLVTCAFLLSILFSSTKPRATSFWQAQLPKNLSELNFLFVGVISLSKESFAWGTFEIILATSGLFLTPVYNKARKFMAHFGDDDLNRHLSASLSTAFIVVPSIAYLVAEVFSCYSHEKDKRSCFPLFVSNWAVSMWLGLTLVITLICGITFKSHTLADWTFFTDASISSVSRVVCAFATTSFAFYIFGLRAYNVSQDHPSYDPKLIDETNYRDADFVLVRYSVGLAVLVIVFLSIDGIFQGLKNAYLQVLDDAHEEEELEGSIICRAYIGIKKLEQRMNIERFRVPENVARISPIYEDLILYCCIIIWMTQVIGALLRFFSPESSPAHQIGVIIITSYMLGFIVHGILVTAFLFSEIESHTTNEERKLKIRIVKLSILTIFGFNTIFFVYEGKWKWVVINLAIIAIIASIFIGTEKSRRWCAQHFSTKERRQHLVLCFTVMCSSFPTQMYFIGEVVACMMRQMNYKATRNPETPFELLDNSCNSVLYGISPIAIFNGWCIVQYIIFGYHQDMQHDIRNVIRLKLTWFQLYRVANSSVLVILAVFAYSLRMEDSYEEVAKGETTLIAFIWTGMFLVSVEVALTSIHILYGLITSRLGSKTSSRRNLLPTNRDKLSMEERMTDAKKDVSVWDGGGKGVTTTDRQKKTKLLKDKSIAVFEISPGFL